MRVRLDNVVLLIAYAVLGASLVLLSGIALGALEAAACAAIWLILALVVMRMAYRRRWDAAEAERERLRGVIAGLAGQLLESGRPEMARIGHELQERPLQSMIAAHGDLIESGEADGVLAAKRDLLGLAIAEVRAVVDELHPELVPEPFFRSSLRTAADEAAAIGRFDVDVEIDHVPAPPQRPLALRCARELLVNAAKHARARSVQVSLRALGPMTALTVRDDGVGIDSDAISSAAATGHLGLASVVNDVESAGGRFTIQSRHGRGTTVEALLPEAGSFDALDAGET